MHIQPILAGFSIVVSGYCINLLFLDDPFKSKPWIAFSRQIIFFLTSLLFSFIIGNPLSIISTHIFLTITHFEVSRRKRRSLIKKIERDFPFISLTLSLLIEGGQSIVMALAVLSESYPPSPSKQFLQDLHNLLESGADIEQSANFMRNKYDTHYTELLVETIFSGSELGYGPAVSLKEISSKILSDRIIESEEHALKAPVKLLLPLCLFIFPAIFLIIFSPLIIQLTGFNP